VQSAAKMKELAGDNPDRLYQAACAYALCAAKSPSSSAASASNQEREKLAEEAIGLLKQAVAKGYQDVGGLRGNMDLAALQERTDFKNLLVQLDKRH
jgi:hypothetical protein